MAWECIRIFLESTPRGIDLDEVKESVKSIPKVIEVRDVHIWSLSKEMIAMTAQISINEEKVAESEEIIHEIQHLLKEEYNISHTTFQVEHKPCSSCFHNKPDHKAKCSMCVDSSKRTV